MLNLASICDDHPADRVALISRGRTTTFGELRTQVAALRGGFVELGIEPGDRVGLLCANNWYFVATYLAVIGVGGVVVPLNPASPAPELTRELAAVQAKGVVVGPRGRRTFADIERAELPDLQVVVAVSGEGSSIDDAVDVDALLTHDSAPIVDREADDLAVLMFTSGTAGSPKAAMLTHGCLRANLDQMQAQPFRRQTPEDVSLGVLPFFHIYGLNVILNLSLLTGSALVCIERFDPQSSLDSIATHGVTLIAGAPSMWTAWADLPGASADAFSTVRVAGSGASKLPVEVHERFEERFSVRISEGYGLTEASPVVTNSTGIPAPRGSIGAPLPGVRVRIIDSDGQHVLVGDAGELQVSGPSVFAGYWQDDEATVSSFTDDGWLKTGDLAVVDEKGFLYVVDRMKDLIIVSGFNVYPGEVEEILHEHPSIAMAAVVGVPHPHTGEAVKAYVVLESGAAVEEDDIIDFCEARLARYKCPQKVLFVDEIPQGLGGKVLKRALR